jgi:hypothetical protein
MLMLLCQVLIRKMLQIKTRLQALLAQDLVAAVRPSLAHILAQGAKKRLLRLRRLQQ